MLPHIDTQRTIIKMRFAVGLIGLLLCFGWFVTSPLVSRAQETGIQETGAQETGAQGTETPPSTLQKETALDKQVRVVASKLRCPVCQGESIYDSHSEVALEMKKLIAEKLTAGASELDVLTYFQERYGNYILMSPPAKGIHWVIWSFPVFLGLIGFMFVYQYISASGGKKSLNQDNLDETAGSDKPSKSAGVSTIEELHL